LPGLLADHLPTTEEGVYFLFSVLALAYMSVSALIYVCAGQWQNFERHIFARAFDSLTFCTSVLLLLGLMDEPLLKALGNTKIYLFAAGLLGFLYSIHSLRPR